MEDGYEMGIGFGVLFGFFEFLFGYVFEGGVCYVGDVSVLDGFELYVGSS